VLRNARLLGVEKKVQLQLDKIKSSQPDDNSRQRIEADFLKKIDQLAR
jgi:hypothetical protein